MDEMYNRLMEFAKNKSVEKGGMSNMYVIQKTNLDGELIDEYYGMNLMTDYGMTAYFGSTNSFANKVYIGNGTDSFNHTTKTLVSPITDVSSTLSSSSISYTYPLYYDSFSGLVTCIAKFITCYFDYNIANITDDIMVTEYGLGTSFDNLWTHSYVYDITGSQTYITKTVNERLTFTVFLCYSYYESLITDGYADDRYTLITSMYNFFNYRMYEDKAYTYKRNGNTFSRPKTNTSSSLVNNEIVRTTNITNFVVSYTDDETQRNDENGYINGFYDYSAGFIVLEPQTLTIPENIEFITCTKFSNKYDKFALSNTFGTTDDDDAYSIPITQITPTSVNFFNHKTNTWSNPVSYLNDALYQYSDTVTEKMTTNIRYTNNNTIITMYVCQNTDITNPIIGLDTLLTTVYATNKYWDTSSWIYIDDYNNIPLAAQTARYWIINDDEVSIKPIRSLNKFQITPSTTDTVKRYDYESQTRKGPCNTISNYEYKWYMYSNVVCSTEHDTTFTIGAEYYAGVSTYNYLTTFTYGKWLLVFNYGKTFFYLVDMSDLETVPTIQTITPNFTTSSTNITTDCIKTESETGLIALQNITKQQMVVLDLTGDTLTQKVIDSTIGCCIWNTHKIAYIPKDDTSKVCIYNYDTDTIERDIDITIGATTSYMCGHTKYVWITDGENISYVIDITTGSVTELAVLLDIKDSRTYRYITCVDDVILIGAYNSNNFSIDRYFNINEPTVAKSVYGIAGSLSLEGYTHCKLLYIEDGKTLALVANRLYSVYNRPFICDFGLYMATGDSKDVINNTKWSNFLVPYGECFIYDHIQQPIAYYMPTKIVGTTNTITSLNNNKSIQGKQIKKTITNIPEFNGLPPGNIQ